MSNLHKRKIVVSSSLCPPAVRTVVAHVSINEEDPKEFWREIVPVLAIESQVFDVYAKTVSEGAEIAPMNASPAILKERGYELRERSHEYNIITIHEDRSLESRDEDGDGEMSRTIACSWPPEQDDARLESIFLEMEKELSDLYQESGKKRE